MVADWGVSLATMTTSKEVGIDYNLFDNSIGEVQVKGVVILFEILNLMNWSFEVTEKRLGSWLIL